MPKKTYVEINLDNLKTNIENIKSKYDNYKYYIGMIKSNAYNHGYYIVNTLIESGINYFAVSSIDEAIMVRKYNKNIPILVTQIIDEDEIILAVKNNITITIDNLEYLKKIKNKCTIHVKINTGMNRLGVSSKEEFNKIYEYAKKNDNIYIQGIYTHFATSGINDKYYDEQIEKFKEITSDIDLNQIEMVHLSSSFSLINHPKIDFENSIRIGTIMYGYDISLLEYSNNLKDKIRKIRDNYLIKKYNITPVIRGKKLNLKPAFKLKTSVMEIRNVKKGSLLGYGTDTLHEDATVAVLPIGYNELLYANTLNRYVLINNKKYRCIGHMCMNMMFILVDESIKIGDEVTILGDELTLGYISRLNGVSIHNILVNIGKNLPKVYIKNGQKEKEE